MFGLNKIGSQVQSFFRVTCPENGESADATHPKNVAMQQKGERLLTTLNSMCTRLERGRVDDQWVKLFVDTAQACITIGCQLEDGTIDVDFEVARLQRTMQHPHVQEVLVRTTSEGIASNRAELRVFNIGDDEEEDSFVSAAVSQQVQRDRPLFSPAPPRPSRTAIITTPEVASHTTMHYLMSDDEKDEEPAALLQRASNIRSAAPKQTSAQRVSAVEAQFMAAAKSAGALVMMTRADEDEVVPTTPQNDPVSAWTEKESGAFWRALSGEEPKTPLDSTPPRSRGSAKSLPGAPKSSLQGGQVTPSVTNDADSRPELSPTTQFMSGRRRSPTFSGDDLSDEETCSKVLWDKAAVLHGNDPPEAGTHLRPEVHVGEVRQGEVDREVQQFSINDSDEENEPQVPAQTVAGTTDPQFRELPLFSMGDSADEATKQPLEDTGVVGDGDPVDLTARVVSSADRRQEDAPRVGVTGAWELPGPDTLTQTDCDLMHGLSPSCRTPQVDQLAGESATRSGGAQIFSMADSEPGTPKDADAMSDHDFLLGASVGESPVDFGTRTIHDDVLGAGGGAQQFSMADSDDDVPCDQASETYDLLLDGSPGGYAAPDDDEMLL